MQKDLDNLRQRTTGEVLQHHLDVLGAGDIDATLLDYCPDAVIIATSGVMRGHDQIKAFFINSVTKVIPPGSEFKMLAQTVEGDIAHIVWQAETPFFSIPMGTDTFVIRKGQIIYQTFAGIMNLKEEA